MDSLAPPPIVQRSIVALAITSLLALPACFSGIDERELQSRDPYANGPYDPPGDGEDTSDGGGGDDGDATGGDDGEDTGDGGAGGEGGGGTGGDDGDTGGGDTGGGDGGDTGGGDPGGDGGGDTGGGDTGGGDGGDTGGGDTGGGDTGGGNPGGDEVPDNAYCQEVSNWQASWSAKEEDVLAIVNQVRAQGANCGSEGSFGPAGPLSMHPALRCAARKHSKDMNDRNFFDHTNPSGELPWDRMGKAGYSYSYAGENIAGGSSTASGTMDQWMGSDGHCANIMNPSFTEIGVGYYPGGQWGHLWTQNFGAPG